jgi:hypothetical protein
MSWYDPIGQLFGVGAGDPNNPYRNALNSNATAQSAFGGQLANNYTQNQGGINNTIGMLTADANGANSVSAEQLRQGLQQSQGQQMSMAASASPQNAAMAARTAMINSGNQASGMMGTQALAGVQERQGALNTLANTQIAQSGQNLNGSLGSYSGANSGYGTIMQNPQKGYGGLVLGALGGAAAAAAPFMTGGMGGGGMGGPVAPGTINAPTAGGYYTTGM